MVSEDDKLNRTATVTPEQLSDAIIALEHCLNMFGEIIDTGNDAYITNLRYVTQVLTYLRNREIGSIKIKER